MKDELNPTQEQVEAAKAYFIESGVDAHYLKDLKHEVDCLAHFLTRRDQALIAKEREEVWSPIATAPADGRAVLVCVAGYDSRGDIGAHPASARFETFHPNAPGKASWRGVHGHRLFPTHWMPMPTEPNLSTHPASGEGKL